MKKLKAFFSNDQGLETVEYAIITAMVVAGTIVAITAIGAWVSGTFNGFQGAIGA